MTLLMKKGPQPSFSQSGKPGQRQQERLQRIERRKQRRRTWVSIFFAIVLLTFSGLGFWQLQRINADQVAAANQQATSTADTENTYATATSDAEAASIAATAEAQSAAITATAEILAGTPTPVIGAPTPAADTPPETTAEVITLPSGLQYIDIQEGVGMPAQSVYHTTVYYAGWVQGGEKFDSSADHGTEPFSPNAEQKMIEGWVEGLIGMKVGGIRRLIIPPELGYGDQVQGDGLIPANSTLIFDITLVSLH